MNIIIMNIIIKFLHAIQELVPVIQEIKKIGGTPYLVGGCVRDLVLGRDVKDFDIEVHNISLDDLQSCLEKFGPVLLVGKQFGVLRSHDRDIDWSLPRKDSRGRKPVVVVDQNLTLEEASKRRDVTINAMAIDLIVLCDDLEKILKKLEKENKKFDIAKVLKIIDFYGGLDDIREKKLSAVDEKLFIEDPLRFYRVMQFVGRFEMEPDEKLNKICKKIDLREICDGGEIARERIYEEMKKLFLKSFRPSLGFLWLKKIGRLKELFPEIGALVGVEQRADFHPEGDVFEHTMQTIDASAELPDGDDKFLIVLGALCHDFGKVIKTDDNLSARGHEISGIAIAKKFLHRFTWESLLIRSVCKLVRYHMMPLLLVEQKSSKRAYKRLALKLSPELTLMQLYKVSLCDVRGRNPEPGRPLTKILGHKDEVLKKFLENIQNAKVTHGPEPQVLLGRDLLDLIEPGPKMGEALRYAYKIQIDEEICDKKELKKRVLEKFS